MIEVKWIDRQGSRNISDLRLPTLQTEAELSIVELIQAANADAGLNYDGTVPFSPPNMALPRRRPAGRADDWAGTTRNNAQHFGDKLMSVEQPTLPRRRRYNSGEE